MTESTHPNLAILMELDLQDLDACADIFLATLSGTTSTHVRAVGDELLVTQVCDRIALEDDTTEYDAVVVWWVVDGKLAEAWDIPSVHSVRSI